MEVFLLVMNISGYISTGIIIVGVLWGIVLWLQGVFPVLIRLGKGLSTRKIAIFAEGDNQKSLKDLLADSGLFNKKNIIGVGNIGDLGRAEKATLYVIHWQSWCESIEKLLSLKKDKTGLVVYSPLKEGGISTEMMDKLEQHRNVAVTNFRGRLLGDILLSVLTSR